MRKGETWERYVSGFQADGLLSGKCVVAASVKSHRAQDAAGIRNVVGGVRANAT